MYGISMCCSKNISGGISSRVFDLITDNIWPNFVIKRIKLLVDLQWDTKKLTRKTHKKTKRKKRDRYSETKGQNYTKRYYKRKRKAFIQRENRDLKGIVR